VSAQTNGGGPAPAASPAPPSHYVPMTPISPNTAKMLERTKGLEEWMPEVASLHQKFMANRPLFETMGPERTKSLQGYEQEAAKVSEHLMRELLKLDEFPYDNDAEKKFRKDRVAQIQQQIHISDYVLHEIQKLEIAFGIPRTAMQLHH